jgi:hypothetical protein
MGKKKVNLDELKKNLKTVNKNKMKHIFGGRKRNKSSKNWSDGCGGKIPQ